MSKTVILAINAKYVHTSLSAWTLAAAVQQYAKLPHEITVIEATINQRTEDIAKQVAAHNPDVVGVSTYIWNAKMLPELLMLLRERLPETVFVLGGPEASHRAEHWLGYDASSESEPVSGIQIDKDVEQGANCVQLQAAAVADFVVQGEGEYSFPALLDMLEENNVPESRLISGIEFDVCTRHGADWVRRLAAESEPISGIETMQSTEQGANRVRRLAAANRVRQLAARIAYIETSRGCPFSCAFCLSGGSGVRFFPIDAAKEQLLLLSKSDTQTIKFVDRTFNCNAKRAYELWEFVIGLDTSCCFHFEVAADLFDERTLSLLSTAPPGRIQLEAGLQSFFEPALNASMRQTDLSKAERNIRAILSGGNIHVHVDLIAGLPYETLSDFMDSFDRAYALQAHTLQLGFLKLLYGSKLREQAYEIVCEPEPPYEIISSKWLSKDDLAVLKQTENALQHTYNKGRFLSAIKYVLSVSGLRPFEFYRRLGEAVSNHGMPLKDYAAQIYRCCTEISGVATDELRSRMICDWLSVSKGANMPDFLKIEDRRRKQVAETAENLLGRKLRRHESAVLPCGKGIFVDSESRDAVTGLYKLHFVEF